MLRKLIYLIKAASNYATYVNFTLLDDGQFVISPKSGAGTFYVFDVQEGTVKVFYNKLDFEFDIDVYPYKTFPLPAFASNLFDKLEEEYTGTNDPSTVVITSAVINGSNTVFTLNITNAQSSAISIYKKVGSVYTLAYTVTPAVANGNTAALVKTVLSSSLLTALPNGTSIVARITGTANETYLESAPVSVTTA